MLRVCGFSSGQVAVLVLAESLALALVGLAAGAVLSGGVLWGLARVPQLQGYLSAQLSPALWFGVIVTAIGTALLGALYPAWFASRIQPVEALRYE